MSTRPYRPLPATLVTSIARGRCRAFHRLQRPASQNPQVAFNAMTNYTVTLIASDNDGADTLTKTNYIYLPTLADATVHHVSYDGLHIYPFKNWNEGATNFQQAIDSAEAGHTVIATNGIYYPRYTLVVDKDITVTSLNGAEATIVHAYGSPQRGFQLLFSGALLEGFTIRNGGSGTGAGVYCSGGLCPGDRSCFSDRR